MLEHLEIGDPETVAPEKLSRKKEELPGKIRDAFDLTPVGEARALEIAVKVHSLSKPIGEAEKIGRTLLRLLKAHAKSKGFVAFKASATVADSGERDGARLITLYWQKKSARTAKPEPAVLPMPSEPVTAKPKGRRVPATDELRDEEASRGAHPRADEGR